MEGYLHWATRVLREPPIVAGYPLAEGVFTLATAFGIWNLDLHGIVCAPTSLLQGHALWHRNRDGTWSERELPAKAGKRSDVSIRAVSDDAMWLLISTKKKSQLWQTAVDPGAT